MEKTCSKCNLKCIMCSPHDSSLWVKDWLDVYPTIENKEIVIALNACGANVGFVEINSDKGHDSFLLEVPEFLKTLSQFLNANYNEINNEKRI